MLRFETAGESHGECLVATINGLPAGIPISLETVNRELWRRQQGYGRGGRMKIETDRAEIVAGVRHSQTIGSPVAILIRNKDWQNWTVVGPFQFTKDARVSAFYQKYRIDLVTVGPLGAVRNASRAPGQAWQAWGFIGPGTIPDPIGVDQRCMRTGGTGWSSQIRLAPRIRWAKPPGPIPASHPHTAS